MHPEDFLSLGRMHGLLTAVQSQRELLEGKTIDQIISGIPSKRVSKKADKLREAIRNSIDPNIVFLIKTNLEVIDAISEKIKLLDAEISAKVKLFEDDLKIVLSIPGTGLISVATILAEMGVTLRIFQVRIRWQCTLA